MLSTQVARPLVEIFFGRIDARTVTSAATGALLERYFPASYELVEPGAAATDWGAIVDQLRSDLPAPGGAPPRSRRRPRAARDASPSGR